MDKLMEKIKVRELQIGLGGRGVVVRHLQLVITNNFFLCHKRLLDSKNLFNKKYLYGPYNYG